MLTEADYLVFEAIYRHGPLPTHYLFALTQHVRCNYANLQYRLTKFYHGDQNGPLLVRPHQQFAGFEARYQHVVYDLAPRAKAALAERGRIARYSPRRIEPFLHQLMQACVGASIEITARAKGLRYIPREEILCNPRCPASTREASNPLVIPLPGFDGHALVPDDLFGLEYPGAGFRFFAVEIDRNTESIERKNLDQTAFSRKITGYLDMLRAGTFRSWWGVPNLHVLTVTTNATHARNILECIARKKEPHLQGQFAIACEPSFGANWRVPKRVLSQLLSEPWTTAEGRKDIGSP